MPFISLYSGIINFSPSALCSRIPGLSPKQKRLCIESSDAVVALGNGHKLGAMECQHQFRGDNFVNNPRSKFILTNPSQHRSPMELQRGMAKRCIWTCDISWLVWRNELN